MSTMNALVFNICNFIKSDPSRAKVEDLSVMYAHTITNVLCNVWESKIMMFPRCN